MAIYFYIEVWARLLKMIFHVFGAPYPYGGPRLPHEPGKKRINNDFEQIGC